VARITPPQQLTDLGEIKDYEPYRMLITGIDWDESDHPQYGHQRRMVVDFASPDDESFTVRDWISPRLGRQQNGQVSKLRQLLNAVAGQPPATEIAWFDDETLEWSYDGQTPYAKLEQDFEVIVRGQVAEKETDQGKQRRYRINIYQKADEPPPTPPPAPVPSPAPPRRAAPRSVGLTPLGRPAGTPPATDDEVPF
jgi:hypothetical protein